MDHQGNNVVDDKITPTCKIRTGLTFSVSSNAEGEEGYTACKEGMVTRQSYIIIFYVKGTRLPDGLSKCSGWFLNF